MIIMYIGTVGSGKTLSAVYECWKYYKRGYQIYANIRLSFPHREGAKEPILLTKRVFDMLVKEKTGLQNAILLIDEVHIWLDSRSSMQKKNKAITYFILQTRKKSVRLLVTTQHAGQTDKRLRDTTDILVNCKNLSNQTSNRSEEDKNRPIYIMQESVFQWKEMQPRRSIILANPMFPLYDTSEIVGFEDDEEE